MVSVFSVFHPLKCLRENSLHKSNLKDKPFLFCGLAVNPGSYIVPNECKWLGFSCPVLKALETSRWQKKGWQNLVPGSGWWRFLESKQRKSWMMNQVEGEYPWSCETVHLNMSFSLERKIPNLEIMIFTFQPLGLSGACSFPDGFFSFQSRLVILLKKKNDPRKSHPLTVIILFTAIIESSCSTSAFFSETTFWFVYDYLIILSKKNHPCGVATKWHLWHHLTTRPPGPRDRWLWRPCFEVWSEQWCLAILLPGCLLDSSILAIQRCGYRPFFFFDKKGVMWLMVERSVGPVRILARLLARL